jgi:nucleoid-associated protein YgaU
VRVKKSTDNATPEYPTKRQFIRHGVIFGVAAVTIGAGAGGCMGLRGRMREPAPPAAVHITRTAGIPAADCQTASYVVRPGDTLYGIAQRVLGNGNLWHDIAAANPGIAPDKLRVGQTLTIPAVSAK